MVRSIASLSVVVILSLAASPTLGATPQASGAPDGDVAWVESVLPSPAGSTLGDALAVGVAASADSYVVVGQRACKLVREGRSKCWGQAWTSADGVSWTAVEPLTSGLDLGVMVPTLSGPEIGVQGVAHGPGGFVAFGRATPRGSGRQVTAVWQSADGSSWQRVATGDVFPAGTRLRTIVGADDGYLLGGVIYRKQAPRAAIWSSPDGVSWTPASGRDAFEVGGYIDTMEDPSSGGINAFTVYPAPLDGAGALASGVVAVGQACTGPADDRSVFAWNGICWGDVWRSPDGHTWKQGGEGAQTRGAASSVAAVGDRIVTDAPICYGDCPVAMLTSDDATAWRVAYGSPVGGPLMALTAADGRFFGLLATPPGDDGPSSLRLWVSDDGSDWRLAEAQPELPQDVAWFHHVDATVAADRLVVIASGEMGSEGAFGSVVLRSPPLEGLR